MQKVRLFVVVMLAVCMASVVYAEKKTFTIINTNDLHYHLLGFSPNIDYTPFRINDDKTVGGWARIATVLHDIRKERENPVLTLDAGDFTMGSLFHMITREEAVELKLLRAMGYDVMCLGNHEFDLMPPGLARILNAAYQDGGLPQLVLSNARFSAEKEKDDTLEAVFKRGIVKPYTILERDGVRIGIYGLMGKVAAEDAPFASPMKFDDIVETSKKMVKLLREEEKVDMVICLSHSGLDEKKSKSEDEVMAKEVDGIDIIISGHTHTKLLEPIVVNDTIIVQAWEYGKHVGVLDFTFDKGNIEIAKYRIIEIDDTIKGDAKINNMILAAIDTINETVLNAHNLSFKQVIAKTRYDMRIEEDECNLGNMIADSMRWYVNRYDYDEKDPVTKVVIAIESRGLIRDDLLVGKTGDVAVCDLFRTFPLGIGMDDTMCYPIVTMYIYGQEIKKALEILTSVYPLKGSSYFIQLSGLKFTYNPNRVIFDRVTEIWLGDEESGYKPLDYSDSNKQLYRIAANIYNSTFLKVIGSFTMNILDIVPKDRQGNPIKDLKEVRVDMDKDTPGIQELKEWIGLMEYVRSFKDIDGDGLPDISEKYKGKLGRIVKQASWNPVSLLSRGTWLTWIGFAVFLVVLGIVALIARFVIRRFVRA
jgi:5'-nucleotidase/UDP-sugar diphosphatase